MKRGRYVQAVPVWRECIRLSKLIYGAEHSCTITCIERLGVSLTMAGNLDEALGYLRIAYEFFRTRFSEDSAAVCISCGNLAFCLVSARKYDEAEPLLEGTIPVAVRLHGPSSAFVLRLQYAYADCLARSGKHQAIIELGERVLGAVAPSGRGRDKYLVKFMRHAARAHYALGNVNQALDLSLRCAALGRHVSGPGDYKVLDDMRLSSRCFWRLERHKEAIAVLEQIMEIVKKYRLKTEAYHLDVMAELEKKRRKTEARIEANLQRSAAKRET
jgi:tetratricopeptide (TPR) repeat protein